MANEWTIPTTECVMCGHQEIENLELRPVSENLGEPGTLQNVCIGCGGKWDTACLEAAAEEEIDHDCI